ncbi:MULTISPECIES: DUF4232 domain-containing protein [unclassified Streptomyces]|uniref:DUF4232 domain-containing protein n=1 Tax=unclassified Streptomyces TaxID=2593676 RepID=UPI0011AD7F5A|nr:DUF4232 domain-containing protein [Streptomyces sp. BK340]TVZ79050.1 uncharacterized protein DUF4232 [Streptomyces sp. BK340]
MRVRTTVAAATLLVAGLALTACQGDDGKAAGSPSGAGTATATSTPGKSQGDTASAGTGGRSTPGGTAGSSTSGGKGTPGGKGGTIVACTAKTTGVTFVAAARHATESEPAAATVKITNTSGKPCTIVGASSLVAKDDQGKSDPIETDNSAAGTDAVDLAPGATATADVLYADLNFEGSQSAREVCGVQASKVEIALPKDVGRTVKVVSGNGSAATFNVCGPDVKFEAFHA